VIRRLPFAVSLLVALLSVAVPVASAHTELVEATPAADAILDSSPPQVVLVFNEAIQADRSSVVVLDQAAVTVGEGGLDPADATRLVADLPLLSNGMYTVRWTAFSDDGHLIRDQYTFEVAAEPTPEPTTEATPKWSATPAPTPAPSTAAAASAPAHTGEPATPAPSLPPSLSPVPAGGGDGQTDTAQVLMPLVAGGLIVGGIAVFLVRRRRP
jgi:methionine-rich copper-binding protein CopC